MPIHHNDKKSKITKFVHSLGFAVCFLVLYLLFVHFFIEPSGYDGIAYYLYFPPFVFVGGILLFYVYRFFKAQKKMTWFYGGLIVLIILSAYNAGFRDVDIWTRNLLHFAQLPKEYQDYQDIGQSIIRFGSKEMKKAYTSDNDVQTYLTQNDELIVIIEKIRRNIEEDLNETAYTIFKLDRLGNEIARHIHVRNHYEDENEQLFEGYFVNVEGRYYHTWALDGDTLRRKIESVNEKLDWDKEKQKQFYREIEKNATMFFRVYDSKAIIAGRTQFINKIVYQLNGSWYSFYFDLTYDEMPYPYLERRGKTKNSVFRRYSAEEMEWIPVKNENIRSVYFHKEKLVRIWHYIGGGSPASSSDEWSGNLYSQLTVGKDRLNFKEKLLLDTNWKTTDLNIDGKRIGAISRNGMPFVPYLYYENPKLGYQLFTNDERMLYLIKEK